MSNYHKDMLSDEQKQQLKKLKQAAQDKANAMNAFINKPAPGTKWSNQINCTVFQQDLGAVIYLAEQQIGWKKFWRLWLD